MAVAQGWTEKKASSGWSKVCNQSLQKKLALCFRGTNTFEAVLRAILFDRFTLHSVICVFRVMTRPMESVMTVRKAGSGMLSVRQ
jgi:hypothetical protein